MARVADVARAAGVSVAAVSYAFSDNPQKQEKLSRRTREKILEVARTLDYRPSLQGRALSLNKTFSVALLLPARCVTNISTHYLHMFHGVSHEAAESDYNLSVFFGCSEKLLQNLAKGRFDGVIVISSQRRSAAFDRLAALPTPLVVLNRAIAVDDRRSYVQTDRDGWVRDRLHELKAAGCRRIAFFLRLDNNVVTYDLLEAFQTHCRALALAPREVIVSLDNWEEKLRVLLAEPDRDWDGLLLNLESPEMFRAAARAAGLAPGRDFPFAMIAATGEGGPDCYCHDSYRIGREGWQLMEAMLRHGNTAPRQIPYTRQHALPSIEADF